MLGTPALPHSFALEVRRSGVRTSHSLLPLPRRPGRQDVTDVKRMQAKRCIDQDSIHWESLRIY